MATDKAIPVFSISPQLFHLPAVKAIIPIKVPNHPKETAPLPQFIKIYYFGLSTIHNQDFHQQQIRNFVCHYNIQTQHEIWLLL